MAEGQGAATSSVWRFLATPSPMHDGLRLVDLLVTLVVITAGVVVRALWWDSEWTMLALPLSLVAFVVARLRIPSARPAEDAPDA